MKFPVIALLLFSALGSSAQQPFEYTFFRSGQAHVSADGNTYIMGNVEEQSDGSNRLTFIGPDLEIYVPFSEGFIKRQKNSEKSLIYYKDRFEMREVEFRILLNNSLYQDWTILSQVNRVLKDTISPHPDLANIITDTVFVGVREVTGYPAMKALATYTTTVDQSELARIPIIKRIIFSQKVNVDDSISVEFRVAKVNVPLITIVAKRISVKPRLERTLYNEQLDRLVIDDLTVWDTIMVRGFSTKSPSKKPSDTELRLPSNISKVLLLFQRKVSRDSSLLMRFSKEGGAIIDSGLNRHKILLKNLEPGTTYTLSLAYKLQPENAEVYRIIIDPAWYQTALFKWTVAVVAIILIALGATTYYRYKIRRQKQQQARIDLELKSIRSQLNPHFVFNSLSSIQGLINNNEIDKANIYLSEFGSLMRDTLSGGANNNNSLASEIKILDRYLQLEQMRFGFHYEISVDPQINLFSIEVPSLLLQPLVENAVKHGVAGQNEKGRIMVSFEKQETNLLVRITDNGRGFSDKAHNGFGIKLTRDRIFLISQLNNGQEIVMDTKSGSEGTTVFLNFKNWFDVEGSDHR